MEFQIILREGCKGGCLSLDNGLAFSPANEHVIQSGLGFSRREGIFKPDALHVDFSIPERDLGIIATIANPQSTNRMLALMPYPRVLSTPMLTSANTLGESGRISCAALLWLSYGNSSTKSSTASNRAGLALRK
jgi:hypothetical protein